MTKNINIIILIIIISIIFAGCNNMQQLEEATRPIEPVQEQDDYIPENAILAYEGYNIYTIGEVEDFYIELALKELQKAKLYDNSYNIILTDYYLDGTEENKQIVAQTHHHIKTIYIHQFEVKGSLLHEIGHVIERSYNFSEDEDFLKIYNKVAFTGEITNNDEYHRSSAREYFAENYKNYVNGILIYGDTYEYFKELLN